MATPSQPKFSKEELLAKLKEGAEAWNEWRRKNPEIRPNFKRWDLSEAGLIDYNLSRIDFRKANLSHSFLSRANLSHADLFRTNLASATMRKCDLTGAFGTFVQFPDAALYEAQMDEETELRNANFTDADLGKVKFSAAKLTSSYFTRAKMQEANLSGAILDGSHLE